LAAEADYAGGAPDPARAAMDKALQARIRLAAHDPEEAWGLAGTWRLRAALRAALGDADVAAESLRQARSLAETLYTRAPQADAPARFLAHTLLDQADHALRTGQMALARDAADAARMMAERFARTPDAAPAWFAEAGACWDRLGEVARAGGARAKAQEAFARALEFRRLAKERAPDEQRYVRGVAAALIKLGEAELEGGAPNAARTTFAESVALRLQLAEAAPDAPQPTRALAAALERLGLAALACGDAAAARGAWEDELCLADRFFGDDDLDGARFRAIVHAHLAGAGGPRAEEHRRSALARFDELAKAGALSQADAAVRKRLWTG
jgi:hypothetical protein